MIARLKPGVTPAAQMDIVGKQLEQQYPDVNAGYGIYVNPLENHIAGSVRTPLLGAARRRRFVLLIACVNVAELFLARTRDLVVRSAMGASRGSLVRQLFLEAAGGPASERVGPAQDRCRRAARLIVSCYAGCPFIFRNIAGVFDRARLADWTNQSQAHA
jgi:hypothetical protein